jgi:starch synthase
MVEALTELLPGNRFRFVLLGSGDEALEEMLLQLRAEFPNRVGIEIGYDQSLSHKIEAGADFFLMPSRFEPCGLNQLYSLRYGTIPIVHAVGGLKDSITDISHPKGNGISYDRFEVEHLTNAIHRALKMFCDNHLMERARERGMRQDFSWPKAAERYLKIYEA